MATTRLEAAASQSATVDGNPRRDNTLLEIESRLSRYRGWTLPLLVAVFATHFVDRQLLAILIPPIKTELGLSDTALGLISGFAFTVLFSTVGLAIGCLADRVDRARVISWSLTGFSAMTALCGLATGFWGLFVARVGVGIGEGGTNPASHSLIADQFPVKRRATAMAIYALGPHLGLVLAFALGGWLAQTVGWRATFMIVGAAGLIVALITSFALQDPRSAKRVHGSVRAPGPLATVNSLLRSNVVRHLFAGGTLATAAALGLVTWLPALLTREYAMTLSQTGIVLALAFGVLGAAGTYLLGRAADHFSDPDVTRKPRILAGCQLMLAALWLAMLFIEDRDMALATLCAACVLIGAYVGPTLALVQDVVDPRSRAFSAAVLLLVVNLIGATIGPLAVGMLSDALAPIAGVHSLRHALLLMPVVLAWSSLHYACAASGHDDSRT